MKERPKIKWETPSDEEVILLLGAALDQTARTALDPHEWYKLLAPLDNREKMVLIFRLFFRWSWDRVAKWSGVSHTLIYALERRAIKKLKPTAARILGESIQPER